MSDLINTRINKCKQIINGLMKLIASSECTVDSVEEYVYNYICDKIDEKNIIMEK